MRTWIAFVGGAAAAATAFFVFQYTHRPHTRSPEQAVVRPVAAPSAVSPEPSPTGQSEASPKPVATPQQATIQRSRPRLAGRAPSDRSATTQPLPQASSTPVATTPVESAKQTPPHHELVTEASGPVPQSQPSLPPAREPHRVTIPAGFLITVRLAQPVSSARNSPGDTFLATLDEPLVVDGFVIAEKGAKVEGEITEVDKGGRVKGRASITLRLTRLHTSDGQVIAIHTDPFEKVAPSSTKRDAAKIAVGAAIGAAIGAIADGGKGAAIGAAAGGGAGTGAVMATRGEPASLPVESRLTFRLRSPVSIVEKIS